MGVDEALTAAEPKLSPELVAASRTVLNDAFTVVPPLKFSPFSELVAPEVGRKRSPIILLKTLIVVPLLTVMPFTTLEALLPVNPKILLRLKFTVVPDAQIMPDTVFAPLEVSVLTVFWLKVDVPLELVVIAVMVPPPVKLLTRLLATVCVPPKPMFIPVIVLVEPPLVQLAKVFPLTVLVTVPTPLPSKFAQPAKPVVPVKVILEKLLLLLFENVPEGELPPSVCKLTVPPAPVLLNAVTMLLPLTFFVPPVGSVNPCAKNVTAPVELTIKLVKVLLLMLEFSTMPV